LRFRGSGICRLRKAIYSIKQSPRAWFQRLSEALVVVGLQRSSSDHSLFVRKINSGTVAFLVYVDDLILTSNDVAGIF
jgi:hypothetical protein